MIKCEGCLDEACVAGEVGHLGFFEPDQELRLDQAFGLAPQAGYPLGSAYPDVESIGTSE